MNLIINGSPALLSTSKCACSWSVGRLIEVADPGQNSVYVGGPMNITINEPTLETQQALSGGSQPEQGIGIMPQVASNGVQVSPNTVVGTTGPGAAVDSSAQVSPNTSTVTETDSTEETSGLLVKAVKGTDKAYNKQDIEYEVASYGVGNNYIDKDLVEEVDKKRIRWAVKVDGGIKELTDKKGKEKMVLEIPDAWAGKDILVMACIQGFNEKVSCKTNIASLSQKLLIRSVKGETEEAYVGYKIIYEAIYNKNESEMSEEEKNKKIRWAIKANGGYIKEIANKDIMKVDKKGRIIAIEMKKEWVGKIVVMACIEGFNENVSQETKVRQTSASVIGPMDKQHYEDEVNKTISLYTKVSRFKQTSHEDYKKLAEIGYIKEASVAYEKGMENLKNKYFIKALYEIQQNTYSDKDNYEYGFTGKKDQKIFQQPPIRGNKNENNGKSIELHGEYSKEDTYGAHSHISKSSLTVSTIRGDLRHSFGEKKDLYVITKIGEIFFTTKELAKIGIDNDIYGKREYGQVYLGNIKDFL